MFKKGDVHCYSIYKNSFTDSFGTLLHVLAYLRILVEMKTKPKLDLCFAYEDGIIICEDRISFEMQWIFLSCQVEK